MAALQMKRDDFACPSFGSAMALEAEVCAGAFVRQAPARPDRSSLRDEKENDGQSRSAAEGRAHDLSAGENGLLSVIFFCLSSAQISAPKLTQGVEGRADVLSPTTPGFTNDGFVF